MFAALRLQMAIFGRRLPEHIDLRRPAALRQGKARGFVAEFSSDKNGSLRRRVCKAVVPSHKLAVASLT